ncbi:hypothetical protein ACPPVO_21375 [Dactylosporangium sp. McL0621]|uniref:hypothetical protein n=1 Tax=Dactylosporangium sp. McL0621 TaxID=3415678 RepID=UPI003CEDB5BE
MASRAQEQTHPVAVPTGWPTRLDWQRADDRSPDDFDPDEEGTPMINPATGLEYGEVDNSPRVRRS